MMATAPGEKLLIGRRPMRNLTQLHRFVEADEFSLAYYDETPWHETNVLLLKMRQNSRTTMYRSKKIFRLRRAFVPGPCPRKKK